MPSLADLPEIIGFFSYSRDDDREFGHSLTTIRTLIQNELRARLGRSRRTLRLWQDEEAIPPGAMWEGQIRNAIDQSVFFIPIITPRVLSSRYCGREFQAFLEREKQLGRNDLVFPILYIDVDELEEELKWRGHPVLEVIGTRQYVDWREYRFEPDGPALRRGVSVFSAKIVSTLRHPMPEPHPVEANTTRMVPKATPPTDDIEPIPPVLPIAPKPAVQPAEAIVEPSPVPTPRDHPSPAGGSWPVPAKRKRSLVAGLVLAAVGLILLASSLTEYRTAAVPPQPSSRPPTPLAPTFSASPAPPSPAASTSPPSSLQPTLNPAPAGIPSTPTLTLENCKNSKVVDKMTSAYATAMKFSGQNFNFPIDYKISLTRDAIGSWASSKESFMCEIEFSSGFFVDYWVAPLGISGCSADKGNKPSVLCDQIRRQINP